MGPRMGLQHGRSVGLRRGAAAWGCVGGQLHGAVLGRSCMGLRRGAAAWGCGGAQQRGAAHGRSVALAGKQY